MIRPRAVLARRGAGRAGEGHQRDAGSQEPSPGGALLPSEERLRLPLRNQIEALRDAISYEKKVVKSEEENRKILDESGEGEGLLGGTDRPTGAAGSRGGARDGRGVKGC